MKTETDKTRLLVAGAHPDDIEFGMGGVLLKEAAGGAEIYIVITSKGESGSSGTPEIRERETRSAADQLGAADRITFLDFGGDGQQEATPEHSTEIARIIREVRPSMVFAPSPRPNQHPDHAAVGTAVRNACRLARYGGLTALKEHAPHRVDSLWFYSLMAASEAPPSLLVLIDISGVVDDWKKLMACHQSQVSSRDYIDLQLARARQFGLQAGCDYAAALWPGDPPVLDRVSDLPRAARGF